MTDHSTDPKFAFYREPERAGRKWISVSKCDTVLNCPWSYHARYELKLPQPPPSKAIVMGRLFDELCELHVNIPGSTERMVEYAKTRIPPYELSDDEFRIIGERFEAYRGNIPIPSKVQVPIELDLDYKGYWVQGFLDILPDDPDEPIREVKFSQRPWSDTKYKRKKFQGVVYSVAWSEMMKLDYWRPTQFDVSNYEDDQIQTWLVTPSKHMWVPARKRFLKAIDIIEGQHLRCPICNGRGCPDCKNTGDVPIVDRDPSPGILCGGERLDDEGFVKYTWECDYLGVCPYQEDKRRVKEIAERI